MSTFAELSALQSPGAAILVDVSTDYFISYLSVSGVTQRWSTVAGFFNNPSNQFYPGGIVSVGRHQRSLGSDGVMTSSTISLVLDNTDGGFDWLTAPGTVASTLFKARFRVFVALFDPANPNDNQLQLLGTFVPLDMPTRDEARVFLELADDALGDAADIALTPSLHSWLRNASTTSSNTPWASGPGSLNAALAVEYSPNLDPDRPLPLAFGTGRVPLVQLVRGALDLHPFVICCTTKTLLEPGSPASLANPANASVVFGLETQNFGFVPRSEALNIGFHDRSPFSIPWDGKTWRIHLWQFQVSRMRQSAWVMDTVLGGEFGATGSSIQDPKAFMDAFVSRVGAIWIRGWPLSSHTYPPIPVDVDLISVTGAGAVTCINIARDLLQQYARQGAVIDVTSFDDVAGAMPSSIGACYVGDIGNRLMLRRAPSVISEGGQLREILQGLCRAGQFDLVTLSAGQIRALANTASYAAYVGSSTKAILQLDETRIVADSLKLRIPSSGQRWAPYNRVFLDIGLASGDLSPGRHGPFDHQTNLTAWGRPFTRIIDAAYADVSGTIGNVFVDSGVGFTGIEKQFLVESKVRPVITFRYGHEALLLDLGDIFLMSVTRGGQTTLPDTYIDAVWKVEALTFVHETGQVEVEAVWVSDLATEVPFLLDDETLITRADSATYGGGGVDVIVDNSIDVQLTGGSLITANVAVGDILVLMKEGVPITDFSTSRGIRITAINSATDLQVSEPVLSTVGSDTVSTWKILRGHTTYPGVVVGDYNDGSLMYGKASDTKDGGRYSNTDPGNRLLGG